MRTKATHRGTCQVCGCLQKLPNGRLSQHGYTTRCGFFEGVCTGAGALPFEQDKSLIDGAIECATQKANGIRIFQQSLLGPIEPGTTKAWVRPYMEFGGNAFLKPGYYWYEVELYAVNQEHGDHKWTTFHYPKLEGMTSIANSERHREVCAHSSPRKKTIEEAVADCNRRKAESLNEDLNQIAQYISWQRDRIKNWKPSSLKPIK